MSLLLITKGINAPAKVSLDVFSEQVENVFKKLGYKVAMNYHNETCLPEDKDTFEQMFYNVELNKIKKSDLIKRRIAGLTSFYQYQDKNTLNLNQLK